MIDKGSYVRKKNYEFFKNSYLSGNIEFLAAIFITTIQVAKPGYVRIQGEMYSLDNLVEITKEEAEALNQEWNNTKLSDSVVDSEYTHFRKDNGEAKKAMTKWYALQYIFTHNKKNPNEKLNAYVCTVCGEIHCGKAPISDYMFITDSYKVEHKLSQLEHNLCQHMYSKSMNQPYPRLCLHCNQPQEVNAT